MAKLHFNIAEHPELEEIALANKPMPVGVYKAHVTESSWETSSKGHEYMNFEFTILGSIVTEKDDKPGSFAGRKLWHGANLNHPGEWANKGAQVFMGTLLKACGLNSIEDTSALHGISILIKIALDEKDATKNVLAGKLMSPAISSDPEKVISPEYHQASRPAAPVATQQAFGGQPSFGGGTVNQAVPHIPAVQKPLSAMDQAMKMAEVPF